MYNEMPVVDDSAGCEGCRDRAETCNTYYFKGIQGKVGLQRRSSRTDDREYYVVCQLPEGAPAQLSIGDQIEMSGLGGLVDWQRECGDGSLPPGLVARLKQEHLLQPQP